MMERMDEEFRALVQKEDLQMHAVIERHPTLHLPSPRPPFEALVRIVGGQQLSVKAAGTVASRVEAALDGQVTPQQVLAAGPDVLRRAGLSGAKSRSVTAIAQFAGNDAVCLERLLETPWVDARASLLKIRGIGPWSVDMYAMFGLGMADVFSSGDLGLRVAMETHLNLSPKQKPAVYDQRALSWRPYRTLASLHLWHSLKPASERFVD